jgi:predicted transcriptional regulator
MSGEIEIEVGTSAEEMGRRFVEAWEAAEQGEVREPRRVLVFQDFETLVSVLSSARLRLLKHLAREPASSIRALAGRVGRDYRRVHDDVTALVEAGLIERHGLRLSVSARAIQARLDLTGEPA